MYRSGSCGSRLRSEPECDPGLAEHRGERVGVLGERLEREVALRVGARRCGDDLDGEAALQRDLLGPECVVRRVEDENPRHGRAVHTSTPSVVTRWLISGRGAASASSPEI